MSEQRSGPALIDLLAVVISPILVMMMVGSLVFFLIEVLYAGKYSERLIYTFFFFVIGAVLIARISIQLGAARAGAYAAGLGVACFLAMWKFAEYPTPLLQVLGPVLNIFLMALVWWSAHKLTWDCTHLDEDRKASGRGVLAAAGLEDMHDPAEDDANSESSSPKKKGRKSEATGLVGWWERWQAYREKQKQKPHTPGTWILYFGLAAIPLFALGQSLIPSSDGGRRRATFWMMVLYAGSTLALLVSTTLFGLRKYLDERNARIPATLTLGWLGLGLGLIVTFLVVASVLPRPHSETPLISWQKGGQQKRAASKNAQVRDNAAGEEQGAEGKRTQAGDGQNNAKGGKSGGSQGEKKSGGGQGKESGGSQSNNSKGQGDQKNGQQSGNEKSGKNQSDQSKDKDSGSKGPNAADPGKQGQKSQQNQQDAQNKSEGGNESSEAQDQNESQDGNDSGSSPPGQISQALESLGEWIKWLVWIVIAIAILAGIVWLSLRGLAPFTKWAQDLLNWLKSLFGAREKAQFQAEEQARKAEFQRPPPFRAFLNPFADSNWKRRDPSEIVEYSFAALDSWAWDQDEGREADETPMEFAVRLGHSFPDLDEPAFVLADLYVRVVYSRRELRTSDVAPLEQLWDLLEEQPGRVGQLAR